jgi:hypothetical protein
MEESMTSTMRICSLMVLALLLALTVSCSTTPVCISPSNTPIPGNAVVQNLGKTAGSDTTWSFLGLWMWGRPDIDAAMREAISAKGGNALVGVQCYKIFRWFVLFSTTTVRIEGEAVRMSQPAPAPARGSR